MRDGRAIGIIGLRRTEVDPFTETQITLLETFADQAVIAIENARLFQELEDRNRELDLALEQQTATGEVLRVIASSPTDLQTGTGNSGRECRATMRSGQRNVRRVDGDMLRLAAHVWSKRHHR